MKDLDARKEVIEAGRKLVDCGLTARTWGNISCRINSDKMIITPSGRDYKDITPEELVEVNIADISYSGNIKPSVEKSFHAEIYKLHPEVNFIIHTHQVNASAVSIIGKDVIRINGDYPLLGEEVQNAKYGIPGSKKLCKNVAEAVKENKGHAVLLRAHGAVCYGKDLNESFETAKQLEDACENIIITQYKYISGRNTFEEEEMIRFAMAKALEVNQKFDSKNDEGFNIAKLKGAICSKYKNINSVVFSDKPYTKWASVYGLELKPLLDDFAQIAGTVVRTTDINEAHVLSELKNSSAVFIKGKGALCVGYTEDDAEAVAVIVEKTCKCFVAGAIFNNIKYLNPIECFIMRKFYLNKYSKIKNQNLS